jgi:hypothetical protein
MAEADLITPISPQFRTSPPKPRMTVYFAMNILSLLAMLVACLFLYLEIRRFGGFKAVPGTASVHRPSVTLFAKAIEMPRGYCG